MISTILGNTATNYTIMIDSTPGLDPEVSWKKKGKKERVYSKQPGRMASVCCEGRPLYTLIEDSQCWCK